MSEPKWTSGEWKAVRKPVAQIVKDSYGDGGYTAEACFVEPLGIQVYGPDWIHNRACSGQGCTYICDNALLLAASKDLYAALASAVEGLEQERERLEQVINDLLAGNMYSVHAEMKRLADLDNRIASARAALAKARGETT